MKLFDEYEAVKTPDESGILVTDRKHLRYVYDVERKNWFKYRAALLDKISPGHYPDICFEEFMETMGGIIPTKEVDFLRRCPVLTLEAWELEDILEADYLQIMSDESCGYAVQRLLSELDKFVREKIYIELKLLFDNAVNNRLDNKQSFLQIKKIIMRVYGRDILKREIEIIDGHDTSSYYWIKPVRVIDYDNTDAMENVLALKTNEISIEMCDVIEYLIPFFYKYFDENLEANLRRAYEDWDDDDGNKHSEHIEGFEWNLSHNFYTFDSFEKLLVDIKGTIAALEQGTENEYTVQLRKKRDGAEKGYKEEPEIIIDFYQRLIYRIEYMMRVGKEKGFDLISVMGP